MSLPLQVLEEFRLSAIPDALTLANVQWTEGESAVMLLASEAMSQAQKVSNYVTAAAAKVRDRCQFASDGGWFTRGCKLDGSSADVPYFKASKPRQEVKPEGFGSDTKTKTIKYETPAKCPALPILPWVDDVTAQAIYTRYGIEPQAGESFWQAVQRANVPIAIVEGFKKALSLLAHGIPAIAIRGVTQWRVKGTDNLHPILADFATTGREVYIFFDQDDKPKTRVAVETQAAKLGKALEKAGAIARFPVWHSSLGKGVDDVLYGQSQNAATWLEVAIASAQTLKQYKTNGLLESVISCVKGWLKRGLPVERLTKGEYTPELPEPRQGAIHVLDAHMGSGKSYRLAMDYAPYFRNQGCFVVVLVPNNSLGQQIAKELGYPHIHDYKATPAEDMALWNEAKNSGGIVMCPDSLHRLPYWVLNHQRLVVMLDEADQTCDHVTKGDTVGERWSEILGIFAYLLKQAAESGYIVAAESGILDTTLNLISRLSSSDDIRIFQHFKQSTPWETTLFHGHASSVGIYRARFLDAAGRSRLLYVSASQKECRRMERALLKRYPDKKVIRIDGKTNQCGEFTSFFRNPDEWLYEERPDILILSPSAKSGVSIEGDISSADDAYFAAVWGYFPCHDTRTHMQQLGRYRPPVPRFIWCPDFINANGDFSLHTPKQIQARLKKNAEAMIIATGMTEGKDDRSVEERTIAQQIETAAIEYYAQTVAMQGAMMRMARLCLKDALETARHAVTLCDLSQQEAPKSMSELWKLIKEELWREDSAYSAGLKVNPTIHTFKWAKDTQRKVDASMEDREIAKKVLLMDEFPGMNWDDPDTWYNCIYSNDGRMVRGVRTQAQVENLEATKLFDRDYGQRVMESDMKALHRIPKRAIKAMVLNHTSVMSLLDGSTYSSSDPRAIAVKRVALQYAQEIEYWLDLKIREEQTAVEICHKLMKRLGLERELKASDGSISRPGAIKDEGRPGKRGEQRDRVYRVDLAYNSHRVALLEAARRKISESVSMIFKGDTETPHENHGHAPKDPLLPHLRHYLTKEGREFIESALFAAQDAAERLALWLELPRHVRCLMERMHPYLCPDMEAIAS